VLSAGLELSDNSTKEFLRKKLADSISKLFVYSGSASKEYLFNIDQISTNSN